MSIFDRFRTRTSPPVPDRCPSCKCGLPIEPVDGDRFFCPGCAKDFKAVQDAAGDWVFNTTPLRHVARQHVELGTMRVDGP